MQNYCKYYKTNIDKEIKFYDVYTFLNLIALNLNRMVLKTMNELRNFKHLFESQTTLGTNFILFCVLQQLAVEVETKE